MPTIGQSLQSFILTSKERAERITKENQDRRQYEVDNLFETIKNIVDNLIDGGQSSSTIDVDREIILIPIRSYPQLKVTEDMFFSPESLHKKLIEARSKTEGIDIQYWRGSDKDVGPCLSVKCR